MRQTAPRRLRTTAALSNRVAPGTVFAACHFPEDGVNTLLSSSADLNTRCPDYKMLAVGGACSRSRFAVQPKAQVQAFPHRPHAQCPDASLARRLRCILETGCTTGSC